MEDLLERLFYCDAEVFAHDVLWVFISHKTRERFVFHNSSADELQNFIDNYNPILAGYNIKGYDKYILKACLLGYCPEEVKEVNDFIISGRNGWEYPFEGYCDLPTVWDFMNEIVPRKSLKEIEGNLRLDITETTVPFSLPTKWTKEQYEEVLYYCTCDVEALIPLFDKLLNKYKSKYIICKLGKIDPEYGLSLTNANLTATLLGAERQDYDDPFGYTYPSVVQKEKIPKEALEFFDDLITHNDINYKREAPNLHLRDIDFQIGVGGGHGFRRTGSYIYTRGESKKLLCNFDVASLYPNLVRLFGYSSRSQSDKNAYVNLLEMRLKAKWKKLDQEFLDSVGLTAAELNMGLKLPLNAYTGALRAVFNDLYDNLQGFSICTTGQLLILQLIYDLEQVPTLRMVSANTDAVMFEIDPEYKPQALKVLDDWQKLTGLELEEDNIVKIIMANVNNYCELLEVGEDEYSINYKGGRFGFNSLEKNFKLKWNKETRTFDSSFEDDIKTNSLTIVGEALLKNLLLDIPVEDTINNCDDIFRFQMITHLGSTYDRVVQETPNGDVTLQKNNRVYAGVKPAGTLVKIKPDGRRDSVADCPLNPIVDNGNECTIYDINKDWYIEMARLRVNDFKGVRRLEEYKKNELLEMATELGLTVDSKMKKAELIELIKEAKKEEVKEMAKENVTIKDLSNMNIYQRLNEMKKEIMAIDFVLDCDMPGNLGGKDYASIGQYYTTINEKSMKWGLHFQWEVNDVADVEKELFKPQGKPPHHVWTVECKATFTNVDNPEERVVQWACANGSDICDKGVSGASSLAFRNWFDKNFTPSYLVVDEFGGNDMEVSETTEQTEAPKIPTYIPAEKKAELTKEVVKETQVESSESDDVKNVIDNIMKVRELSGNDTWGAATLTKLMSGEIDSVALMEIDLKVSNKLESLGGN